MQKSPLTYKTASILALAIALLLNALFLIMFFWGRDSVLPPKEADAPPALTINSVLIHLAANFIIAFVLFVLNFKLAEKYKYRFKLLVIIVSTFLCTWGLSYVLSLIQIHFYDFGPHPTHFIRGSLMRDSFIAIIVLFTSQITYLWYKQQQTLLENKTLLSENMSTRYEVLKNQVDPHFLFNSLNTLNSLIKSDPDKAQEYVQKLSYVFRYTLQQEQVIMLEEELKFTQSYCTLMQIRYGNNLKFDFRIDEKYHKYSIVPLSLQILVENAIKHNVVTNKQPLTISIFTSDNDMVTVSNPIQLKKEPESGMQIGLVNLEERFRLMWQKKISIHCSDKLFEVSVPLVKV